MVLRSSTFMFVPECAMPLALSVMADTKDRLTNAHDATVTPSFRVVGTPSNFQSAHPPEGILTPSDRKRAIPVTSSFPSAEP